jgi:crossover junction endodeoxyribonuclease RusA
VIEIDLPFPPSTNTYWRHVVLGKSARTLISKRGRVYRQAVADEVLVALSSVSALAGPLACELELYPPDARRRDVDNYAKALLDALDHADVYGDDSQIRDLRIRMHPKSPPGRVTVRLWGISDPQCAHSQMDLVG